MRFKDKFKFLIKAPISWIKSKKYSIPKILDSDSTVSFILEKGSSISRFGDGEFNLMNGVGIKFQSADKELQKRLQEIACSEKEKVLICLPDVFAKHKLNDLSDESKKWWKRNLFLTRGYWYEFFKNELYGDANISRFYVNKSDKDKYDYVQRLKLLWKNKKVLIIEGKKSRLGMGNDLFENTNCIYRLLCPQSNAYEKYNEILDTTKQILNQYDIDLIICALGPTATVLSYDLSDIIQTLDMGHVDIEYEWFLKKSDIEIAVDNKMMSEVSDTCGDNVTETYAQQIVGEIE